MSRKDFDSQVDEIATAWASEPRWAEIRREYTPADVVRLRGSLRVEHTVARHGAERLRALLAG